MPKYKDFEIIFEPPYLLKYGTEVEDMTNHDPELLNSVYKEISETLGMDSALEIYRMFKGQQITFPQKFFNPAKIHQLIIKEYDGTNIRMLATQKKPYDASSENLLRNKQGEVFSLLC